MKSLILAAGYATRLYPLTENFPKPLLKVGDKPILNWLIDDLEKSGLIDEYIVVTNHRFAHIFQDWAHSTPLIPHPSSLPPHPSSLLPHPSTLTPRPITVIDDGTSTNDTRLGAVRDIQLAIEGAGQIVNGKSVNGKSLDDDLLVMAGDNLLSFSLCEFLDYATQKGTSCIMRYYEPNEQKLHKSGVAQVDADDRILSMEEKPAEPKSQWCCPPFYYIVKSDVPKVAEAIASGCGVDAPGSFIAWLCTHTTVHAWEMPGPRYDIGNLESYEEVQRTFKGLHP